MALRRRLFSLSTLALVAGGGAFALGACSVGAGNELTSYEGRDAGKKAKKGTSGDDSEGEEEEDGEGAGGSGGGSGGSGGPDITAGSGTADGGSNSGAPVNVAGFDSVRALVADHCSECHHPGSYLDLEKGADAETARKIVMTLENGSMPPAPRERLAEGDIVKFRAWRDGQTTTAATSTRKPLPTNAVTQILPANTLARYKAALPKVAYARLQAILESPSTLFYDKDVMPGAYQDTVGNGADIPFGARLNSAGAGLIVPQGRKLFDRSGETWEFPFGHTAGTDNSTNAVIVNFISLPSDGTKQLPVAYRIETGTQKGFANTRWNWAFPKGTVVGEIVMINDGGTLVTSEIRMRERYADKWSTNAFRPFPTAKSLSEAVKTSRPNWQTTPALTTFVGALESSSGLTAKNVGSPAFNDMVRLNGFVDAPLPDLGDAGLARDLLTKTPFVSSYGTTWKANGGNKSFGFTGPRAGMSIVPVNFDVGLLEVRETTCTKCHDQGGSFIGNIVDQAVLYGDIWGVDRVFSFYPFEPSRIEASGAENRVVRASFNGSIVERYDAGRHPASTYTFYQPEPR
ncbi:MAG: hypothetical protein U0169_00695 [Polyangiaceae bacterium]